MHLKYFWNAHTEIKKKIIIFWLDLSAQFLLQVNRFQQMYKKVQTLSRPRHMYIYCLHTITETSTFTKAFVSKTINWCILTFLVWIYTKQSKIYCIWQNTSSLWKGTASRFSSSQMETIGAIRASGLSDNSFHSQHLVFFRTLSIDLTTC